MDRKKTIYKRDIKQQQNYHKDKKKKKEEERRKQKQVNDVIYKTTMRGKTKIDKLATTEETKESLQFSMQRLCINKVRNYLEYHN